MRTRIIGQDLLLTERKDRKESFMDESEKMVFKIIEIVYPEWIKLLKEKYSELEGYELYRQILLETFGYDLDRMTMEQERAIDVAGIERKMEVLKLKNELKREEKKKKGKHK